MTLDSKTDHFEGKSVADHLREARTKGAVAAGEIHGSEMAAHLAAATDSSKEMAVLLALLGGTLFLFSSPMVLLLVIAGGWTVWKTGRSAFLGWAKLERLHRLMEQERWEIENNREEEKMELTALYRAKGLSGKLLEQVIDVLMADDNRLLRIMLEEELGLTLESYDHPLKQAAGAFTGCILGALFGLLGFWIAGISGLLLGALSVFVAASFLRAKAEKNKALTAVVWSLAIAFLSFGVEMALFSLFLS
jgi:hypothetical protein